MKEETKWNFRGELLPSQRKDSGNFAVTIEGQSILIQYRYIEISGKTLKELYKWIKPEEYASFIVTRAPKPIEDNTFRL